MLRRNIGNKVMAGCMVFLGSVFLIPADARTESSDEINPIVLLDRVHNNTNQIGELVITTYGLKGNKAGKRVAEKTYHLFPRENRVEFNSFGEKWEIDLNSGKCIVTQGNKTREVALNEITTMMPPTLSAFAPMSPSIFNFKEIYGGYNFRIVGKSSENGNLSVTMDGELVGANGAGKAQLVIDVARGILLRERYLSASGVMISETEYADYKDFGGVFLPMKVVEPHFSRQGETVVTTFAENVSVRKVVSQSGSGRDVR